MKFLRALMTLTLMYTLVGAQQTAAPATPAPNKAASSQDASPLSADQIRALIQQAAENDMQNDRKLLNYTYIEDTEEHHLDKNGQVKSTETRTREVMMLYGSQVERLVAKNGKPLSAKDAAAEDERIQKIINKRRNETPEQTAKRLRQEEKEREDTRRFVREVADAYNFRQSGIEDIAGRQAYVIDAEPRPDFEPHSKEAKFLPKFRFRVWIDKADTEWFKLDAEAIDTVSVGLFLARIHKGSRILIEQTHVNDEVWLPQHMAVKVDVRLALLKDFNVSQDVTYRDYKKFRSDYKIVPIEPGQQ
jgi:hypothetical protein